MTFKFETLLDSMSEIFRTTSLVESLLFFVAMVFFFVGHDKSVWFGVLALFHVARSFVGFAMGRVIPSSYDFVEKLEFFGDKQLEYRLVRTELKNKVQTLIMAFYEDYERLAKLYTILALGTFVLDLVSFFAIYGLLAEFSNDWDDEEVRLEVAKAYNNTDILTDEDAYHTAGSPYIGRFIVVMLYTACDIFFLLWILHFKSRMGENERGYVLKALLGFGDQMRVAFGVRPKGPI